jgi:hypothetical protein
MRQNAESKIIKEGRTFTAAAKADDDFAAIAASLKRCPDTNRNLF